MYDLTLVIKTDTPSNRNSRWEQTTDYYIQT